MSMNSDRHQVQLYVEDAIGCTDPLALAQFKSCFEQFAVGHVSQIEIQERMQIDALAYTVKGVRSLAQGLAGLDQGHETWSVIKLYYSMYFFMRAKLAFHNVAFLRCKNIYTLRNSIGSSPEKKTGERYSGDHKATISIFENEFADNEFFLSQKIDEISAFLWYSSKRDWVNYKRRDFIDGTGMDGLNETSMTYPNQVKIFCNNQTSIYPFDPDYALLALPICFSLAEVRDSLSYPQVATVIQNIDEKSPLSGCIREWIKALQELD